MKNECPGFNPSVKPCAHYQVGGFCKQAFMFRCVQFLEQNEPRLSFSQIKTFLKCHRAYWYRYVQGIEPKTKNIKMIWGSIASEILDLIHNDIPSKSTFHEIINQYTIKLDINTSINSDTKIIPWPTGMDAIFTAYEELYGEMKGQPQGSFSWWEPGYPNVIGFRDLDTHERRIVYEFKYTGSPDWYAKWNMDQQLGIYFLGSPETERITVRLIAPPDLRLARDENVAGYWKRVYEDFKRRPKFYVKDTSYWRTEFPLNKIKERIKIIAQEIPLLMEYGIDGLYQSYQCWSPPCNYLSICNSDGMISKELYDCRNGMEGDDMWVLSNEKIEEKKSSELWSI